MNPFKLIRSLIYWAIDRITDYYYLTKEIYTFLQYVKVVRSEKKKNKFRRLMLRSDWVYRIYTVINLNEEESKWEEKEKRVLLLDKLKEVNDYLTTLNFTEIIYPNIRPIASYTIEDEEKMTVKNCEYAYLITYTYIFDKFNLWFILKHIVLIWLLCKYWSYGSTSIIELLNNVVAFISSHLR